MIARDNKIFLLSRRWPNHAGHSGYDLFGNYVGQAIIAKPVSDRLCPDEFIWRQQRELKGYDRTSLGLELLGLRHMATHRNCLYHALYGDNSYNFLSRLNGWRGHRIIASFHHPPHKFAAFVQKEEALRRLTAVILLGRNQSISFENILPPERIFFVPYATDTAFFKPPDDFEQREAQLCLFVGAHLRDLETLCAVIDNARICAPHLAFAVVVHPSHRHRFEGVVGNLTIYTNISDEDLLDLYQKATLLIQPLVDAVANTAILEGMACGLPMVVTDVGAVRDYATEESARFVPQYDPDALLNEILTLVAEPDTRRNMSLRARERALTFDWHVVSQRMQRVYETVLAST